MPLGELVDVEKELKRLEKDKKSLEGEIARASGKLSNLASCPRPPPIWWSRKRPSWKPTNNCWKSWPPAFRKWKTCAKYKNPLRITSIQRGFLLLFSKGVHARAGQQFSRQGNLSRQGLYLRAFNADAYRLHRRQLA